MHILTIPQAKITFSKPLPDTVYTLVGGGRPPAIGWLQATATRPLWAIDHGLDVCLSADRLPDLIIGDGDSAAKENWKKALSLGIPIEKFPKAKDYTDTQLALRRLKEKTPALILFTGVFGGRLDHMLSTVLSFASLNMAGILADDKECCLLLRDGESVVYEASARPLAVSLLALSDTVTGVTIDGVRWQLKDATLERYMPYAISNELADDSTACTVSIKTGCMLLYIVEACTSADL
ncbi:thiamine diphosphokinase [Selenomonas sp. TAMA-11512]|uniref:thiamine diphosphokinase n=1 Tax=Selenomonas sp. TAMA-11512 TaxID=3095337 RepID=UPI003085945C|nr:thiamine diphosphokinase [Selenomonas sp. TAMA-11512]